jgi:SulP family sulfate permease
MAFAIASGVKPEAGIFTAVIAGFLISALGGTRVAIGGPTGAFIVVLYGINARYGAENLAICTVMAGVILLVMGAARMGAMIKFIPYPVTMGFTSGIAVLIFTTQIIDFFGLKVEHAPSESFERMKVLFTHAATFQWQTMALAFVSLGIILLWPKRWQRHVPGSIVALVVGTLAVAMFPSALANIDLALGRARELFGLPAVESHDPLLVDKQRLETAKREISSALTPAREVSNPSKSDAARPSGRTDTTHE